MVLPVMCETHLKAFSTRGLQLTCQVKRAVCSLWFCMSLFRRSSVFFHVDEAQSVSPGFASDFKIKPKVFCA